MTEMYFSHCEVSEIKDQGPGRKKSRRRPWFSVYRQPSSHSVFIWWKEQGRSLGSVLLGTNPTPWELHPYALIISQRPHLHLLSHWGLSFNIWILGDTSTQFIAIILYPHTPAVYKSSCSSISLPTFGTVSVFVKILQRKGINGYISIQLEWGLDLDL